MNDVLCIVVENRSTPLNLMGIFGSVLSVMTLIIINSVHSFSYIFLFCFDKRLIISTYVRDLSTMMISMSFVLSMLETEVDSMG